MDQHDLSAVGDRGADVFEFLVEGVFLGLFVTASHLLLTFLLLG